YGEKAENSSARESDINGGDISANNEPQQNGLPGADLRGKMRRYRDQNHQAERNFVLVREYADPARPAILQDALSVMIERAKRWEKAAEHHQPHQDPNLPFFLNRIHDHEIERHHLHQIDGVFDRIAGPQRAKAGQSDSAQEHDQQVALRPD